MGKPELEFHAPGRHACFDQNGMQVFFQFIVFFELEGGHVHSNPGWCDAGIQPFLHLPASLAHDPMPERHDQPAFLRDRNELAGRDHSARWMTPTNQRFDTDNAGRISVNLRLIHKKELP